MSIMIHNIFLVNIIVEADILPVVEIPWCGFLLLVWLLCGYFVATLWLLCGYFVATTCIMVIFNRI